MLAKCDPEISAVITVHVTYLTTIRLGLEEPAGDGELHFVEDLVFYDGCYYGDWSVFPAAAVEADPNLKSRLERFEPAKAIRPRKREEKAP